MREAKARRILPSFETAELGNSWIRKGIIYRSNQTEVPVLGGGRASLQYPYEYRYYSENCSQDYRDQGPIFRCLFLLIKSLVQTERSRRGCDAHCYLPFHALTRSLWPSSAENAIGCACAVECSRWPWPHSQGYRRSAPAWGEACGRPWPLVERSSWSFGFLFALTWLLVWRILSSVNLEQARVESLTE